MEGGRPRSTLGGPVREWRSVSCRCRLVNGEHGDRSPILLPDAPDVMASFETRLLFAPEGHSADAVKDAGRNSCCFPHQADDSREATEERSGKGLRSGLGHWLMTRKF